MQPVQSAVRAAKTCKVTLLQTMYAKYGIAPATLAVRCFAVDENGKVISHTIYDPWGNPLTETYTDTNFRGIDNSNNYTGYTLGRSA